MLPGCSATQLNFSSSVPCGWLLSLWLTVCIELFNTEREKQLWELSGSQIVLRLEFTHMQSAFVYLFSCLWSFEMINLKKKLLGHNIHTVKADKVCWSLVYSLMLILRTCISPCKYHLDQGIEPFKAPQQAPFFPFQMLSKCTSSGGNYYFDININ